MTSRRQLFNRVKNKWTLRESKTSDKNDSYVNVQKKSREPSINIKSKDTKRRLFSQ